MVNGIERFWLVMVRIFEACSSSTYVTVNISSNSKKLFEDKTFSSIKERKLK
jgi:hypothetical protein